MTQAQLNRAVSNATGEDFEVIVRRGFSLLEEDFPEEDDGLQLFFDWDEHAADQSDPEYRDRQCDSVA